jgi:hypothetical protein
METPEQGLARYRAKYHASRREVRRLNAALRDAALVARLQASFAVARIAELRGQREAMATLQAKLDALTAPMAR